MIGDYLPPESIHLAFLLEYCERRAAEAESNGGVREEYYQGQSAAFAAIASLIRTLST